MHGVQLGRVLDRQVGRPSAFFLDEFDRNLGGVFAFVDQLGCRSGRGFARVRNSSDNREGSWRYAVINTAGDERPFRSYVSN